MNSLVYEYLRSTEPSVPICALSHQMATLDIALKKIHSKNNFMIAHYMGTGKSYTALFFAIYMSKTRPIMFVLPNTTVKDNFLKEMQKAITYMPLEDFKLDNISLDTRTVFIDDFTVAPTRGSKDPTINRLKARSYTNCVLIIDEAHLYFANDWGRRLLELRAEVENMQFLMLTGTPVSNTVSTLQPLTHFVTGEEIAIKTQNHGNKVVDRRLSDEDKETVMKKLSGLVSYYEQNSRDIPEVRILGDPVYIIPVIECEMEKEQEDDYTKTMEAMDINNKQEMFFRYMSYASFASLGGYGNYNNFGNYLEQNAEVKLTRGLVLNNGLITGPWVNDMRWSTKLKYFINTIKSEPREKRFVFFAHSMVGSVVIRSSMGAHGYTELGKDPAHDAICTRCGVARTCGICNYIRYAVITSNEFKMNNNYIQHVLKIFNAPSNKDGVDLMILFGSKIMSESHNLKEVRDVWILTVPDTHSYLFQTISRSVRTGAFEDISKPIKVRILVASTSTSKADKLRNKLAKDIDINYPSKDGYKSLTQIYKELSDDQNSDNLILHDILNNNTNISHDVKKMIYLEIKAIHVQSFMEEIKKQTCVVNEDPLPELHSFIVKTKLSHFCYEHSRFREEEFLEYARCKFIPEAEVRRLFRTFVEGRVVVETKESGIAILIQGTDGELVAIPASEPLDQFYYSVTYYDTERAERIKTMNKKYNGTYIWVDPETDVPMIRNLTTEAQSGPTERRTLGNASIFTYKTPDIIELVKNRFGIDLIARLRKSYPDQLKITDHRVKMETLAIFKEYQKKYPDFLYYVSECSDSLEEDCVDSLDEGESSEE